MAGPSMRNRGALWLIWKGKDQLCLNKVLRSQGVKPPCLGFGFPTFSALWNEQRSCADTTARPLEAIWQSASSVSDVSDWWVTEWVTGWVSEWVTGWMSEWVSEWVTGWVSEWVTGWVSEWLGECVSKWVNDWVSECVVSEWVTGWVWVTHSLSQSFTQSVIHSSHSFTSDSEWVVSDWLREWLIDWLSGWVTSICHIPAPDQEKVSEWVSDWVSELSDWLTEVSEWLTEWVSKWMTGWVSAWWVSEWTGWVCERVSEWVNDWVSVWVSDSLT